MEVKEWLLNKDEYEPTKDKERFLDKSIIGIITILSKIKRDNSRESGVIYNINPLVKLASTILLIIFLSLSRNMFFVYAMLAYSLIYLCLLDGDAIKRILSVSFVVPIFTLVILLPSIFFMGNKQSSIMLILKIFITVILVNTLSYTTKWSDITKSLKIFFVPDIFILVFDITIRYIYVLGDFSLKMLYSLKLKSIGKNKEKRNSLSRIIGNLFLKSKTMGEDMYSAMECRGFTGEYVSYTKFKFTLIDALYIVINIFMIIIFFII
ncbi:energy-coupling factor transporter transmembrane component T [Clostridium baratii]|uniref:energy-coupling factor transporter transmembrane component T family protein n=1 Tax=Clostridium baratii TaxID=1561 RepID=UPI0029050004|nr:energy-coupling factor transporter transmembrane component T [Clostridium baratii]MDU1054953.1 energy-coupling factor transporter transmembrane component T [Clostridium baratii]